ncbi:hypothetical protein PSPO_b0632 [Pseudoalteromonas spongiae UST010723-006]|nr:hypothetical protein PSPO_b0632 [Pseudoalteromonas spongiae UST010723-006]
MVISPSAVAILNTRKNQRVRRSVYISVLPYLVNLSLTFFVKVTAQLEIKLLYTK